MKMEVEQIKEYPVIALYLHIIKASVVGNQKVWKAFLTWSSFDKDEQAALECLSYGTFPILRIIPDRTDSNGHFLPSEPMVINVGRLFALAAQRDNTMKGIKYLEALILHELCHWARCKTKTADDYYKVMGKHPVSHGSDVVMEDRMLKLDSGKMFMRDAYLNPAMPHLG